MLPGALTFETSSHALLKLLRQKTDMSDVALDTFHQGLRFSAEEPDSGGDSEGRGA